MTDIKIGDWVRFEWYDRMNNTYELRVGVVQYIIFRSDIMTGIITDKGYVGPDDVLESRRKADV